MKPLQFWRKKFKEQKHVEIEHQNQQNITVVQIKGLT